MTRRIVDLDAGVDYLRSRDVVATADALADYAPRVVDLGDGIERVAVRDLDRMADRVHRMLAGERRATLPPEPARVITLRGRQR